MAFALILWKNIKKSCQSATAGIINTLNAKEYAE